MTAPQLSGSTTRPELPNIDDEEENNLKDNFMKMIEAFKQEMKNPLKEIEQKMNKKLKDIKKVKKKNN